MKIKTMIYSFVKHLHITRCLLAAVLVPALSGCIDDTYYCPTEGEVDIAMTHYWHNKGADDRFGPDVTRMELYVFDENGLFHSHSLVDDEALLSNGYHHTLSLPGGTYTVVAWGNGGSGWTSQPQLTVGVTSLEEARMSLDAIPTRANDGSTRYVVEHMPKDLFTGHTRQATVRVLNGKTVRDSIDLMRVTNRVHLRVRWKDRNGYYCTYTGHENTTRPYIEAEDGEYEFLGCLPRRERFLTYMPELLPSEVETPIDYASVRADFRIGRLTAEGNTARVSIDEVLPDGSVTQCYTRNLVELIRLTGYYNTQEMLDREDSFNIDIDFRCDDPGHTHANSWMVIGIRINGWVVKEINSDL